MNLDLIILGELSQHKLTSEKALADKIRTTYVDGAQTPSHMICWRLSQLVHLGYVDKDYRLTRRGEVRLTRAIETQYYADAQWDSPNWPSLAQFYNMLQLAPQDTVVPLIRFRLARLERVYQQNMGLAKTACGKAILAVCKEEIGMLRKMEEEHATDDQTVD